MFNYILPYIVSNVYNIMKEWYYGSKNS